MNSFAADLLESDDTASPPSVLPVVLFELGGGRMCAYLYSCSVCRARGGGQKELPLSGNERGSPDSEAPLVQNVPAADGQVDSAERSR